MNIQEFLDWRHDCFHCGEELAILPELNQAEAIFQIENDWLIISSRFVKMTVHIITGEVKKKEEDDDDVTIDQFMASNAMKIKVACVNCPNSKSYEYSGIVVPFLPTEPRKIMVGHLEEYVYNDYYSLHQIIAPTRSYLCFYDNKGTAYQSKFTFPYLDLKKISPQQLDKKIKTYTVFS